MTAATTPPAPRLKETLGLWQVTISGIGIVIGAGIYVLIGEGTREAGAGIWLSFAVAAVLSGLTALSYCELAGMYPSAGVEYEWARRAFNPFAGFLAGWMMAVAYVIAAAAVSLGFAQYAQHFVEADTRLVAIGLLAVLTLVVIGGLQRSIWLTVMLAVLQIAGLVMVVVAGGPHIGDRDVLEGATAAGVLSGAALVFFAFIGFDDIATLSEETHDAAKVVPRALLLTLFICGGLYVLVSLSAISVVPAADLGASDRPLTLVIEHDWGGRASDIVAWIALASTTNTTLLVITAASRLLYAMGRAGALPKILGSVGRQGRAPYAGAAVTFVVAAAFASAGDIGLVAAVTDFSVYCTFLAVNLSVIALRFRAPQAVRAFEIPLSPGRVPVTAVLGTATVLLMVAYSRPAAVVLGAGVLVVGGAVHLALRRTGATEASRP
jgi:APA family basic amino acid/polyamine antiporter